MVRDRPKESSMSVRSVWTMMVAMLGVCPAAASAQHDMQQMPERAVRRDLVLGAFDDPVLAFSRIASLRLDRQGRVYVVQPSEAQVVVLDRDGNLVSRIGRRGQGPGEFISPADVGWFGDTLWVADVAAKRITYFHDSRLLRTHTYRTIPTGRRENIAAMLPIVGGEFLGVLARRYDASASDPDHTVPLLRITGDGTVLDTIGFLRESYPLRVYIGVASASPLFHDFPLFRVCPKSDCLIVVDRPFSSRSSNEIRITKLSMEGDTLLSTILTSPVVPVSDRDWSARLDQWFDVVQNPRFSRADYLEASRRPPSYAPVSAFVIGRDGWIWLAREELFQSETREWVALDEQAVPRFRVVLPRRFRVFEALDRELWGVQLDSLDVPYIQRYVVDGG